MGGVYCNKHACLSVCESVRKDISETTHHMFTKFCLLVTCGRGSVILWRRCDTLCTSGFMDNVICARKDQE